MDPIQIIELCVIFAIIIVTLMIIKWIMDRHEKCGNMDPLCYITGQKTSVTNILNDII